MVLARALTGHTGDVRCCCVLHDGTIVSGSLDNTLRVWPAAGECQVLIGHTSSGRADPGVLSVATVSPDGAVAPTVAVSAARDGQIIVWDTQTRTALHKISGHGEGVALTNAQVVSSVAVAPSGEIVSGGWDKTARVWTVSADCLASGSGSGAEAPADGSAGAGAPKAAPLHFNRLTLQGHQIAVNAVLGLHNGDIASASGDGTVKIWSGSSGQETVVCDSGHIGGGGMKSPVRALANLPPALGTSARSSARLCLLEVYTCLHLYFCTGGFAAVGNDGFVRLWGFDGKVSRLRV
jgi:phospholipase A-2-activating protein